MTLATWAMPPRPVPAGEPVARELLLKGDFCNGVHLMQKLRSNAAVDQHNQAVISFGWRTTMGRHTAGQSRPSRSRNSALDAGP